MVKFKYFIVLGVVIILFGTIGVKASGDGAVEVMSEEALDECLQNESACRLMKSLNVTGAKVIDHDVVLDLNGYAITPDSSLKLTSGLIVVDRGVTLTINDSKGNGKISTGSGDNVWAAIQLPKKGASEEVAELVVNGGTIEGYYYGIVGNGTVHNTKITINDGTIKGLNSEDSAGIYQPQKGELIINGGTIMGGTGIEIRSGTLTVNNGRIVGTASNFVKVINGNGTTTNGVGVAIAQHTTKNPIKVAIYNGNIEGQYALYEWNPHNNNAEALSLVNMHIYGGDFTGLASGVPAVYSQDFTKFISGGKFNTDVSQYLTEDANVVLNDNDELQAVFNEQKGKNKGIIILVGAFLLALLVAGVVYYKKIVLFHK